jgi:hypothetical protein
LSISLLRVVEQAALAVTPQTAVLVAAVMVDSVPAQAYQ